MTSPPRTTPTLQLPALSALYLRSMQRNFTGLSKATEVNLRDGGQCAMPEAARQILADS